MSTVMYFQIEVTETKNRPRLRWWHCGRIYFSDNYLLFAILAGVRREDYAYMQLQWFAPRGLPIDVVEATLDEDALTVTDEAAALDLYNTCTRQLAEELVAAGDSRFLEDGDKISHPHFHDFSWATVEELKGVQQIYKSAGGDDPAMLDAVIAMMESLNRSEHLTRAIFWFD